MNKSFWSEIISVKALVLVVTVLVFPTDVFGKDTAKTPIREMIGQKLILDLRYFCEQPKAQKGQCRQPLTTMPAKLKQLLHKYNIGGVVLFSENLRDATQIRALTRSLQYQPNAQNAKLPMFIAIDQEGGRVARLPRAEFSAFSGSMAIGATYSKHQTRYATETGQAIGQQLASLGINVNFAPSVDVNSNPENPVINIRAFSDNPTLVGKLALAQIEGMSQAGVSATLKHFPGHGDTNIDSHSGLPIVAKSKGKIAELELKPFQYIFDNRPNEDLFRDFVMTAHMQFPALDSTKITTKNKLSIITPATFSRAIVTDLLKTKMGFNGIVITDALDMAAISQHFSYEDAVLRAFAAGVDVALMPVKINHYSDFSKLEHLFAYLEQALEEGSLSKSEFYSSYNKIFRVKKAMNFHSKPIEPKNVQLAAKQHEALAAELAQQSLVQVFGKPATLDVNQRVLVVMPDSGKCKAWQYAMSHLQLTKAEGANSAFECYPITSRGLLEQISSTSFERLIIGNVEPKQAAYEMVAAPLSERRAYQSLSLAALNERHQQLLKVAAAKTLPVTWLSMRMPYDIKPYLSVMDNAYVSFNYNVFLNSKGEAQSDAITAFVAHLYRQRELTGKLPLDVDSVCPKSLVSCAKR